MRYKYIDRNYPGARIALWLVRNESQAVKFTGSSIPEYCSSAEKLFVPNGKWTRRYYDLDLAPGVVPLYMVICEDNTWEQRYSSWKQVTHDMGLPMNVVQVIFEKEFPEVARKLNSLH